MTTEAWRAELEAQTCGTEVETGAQQAMLEQVGLRTKSEPEGRRKPVEPEGWFLSKADDERGVISQHPLHKRGPLTDRCALVRSVRLVWKNIQSEESR